MFNNWKAKLAVLLAGGYGGIKNNILMPLLGRLGTFVTGWLIAAGAPSELAQQVAIGVTAVGLILFDLLVSWMNRTETAKKAVTKTLTRMGVKGGI